MLSESGRQFYHLNSKNFYVGGKRNGNESKAIMAKEAAVIYVSWMWRALNY